MTPSIPGNAQRVKKRPMIAIVAVPFIQHSIIEVFMFRISEMDRIHDYQPLSWNIGGWLLPAAALHSSYQSVHLGKQIGPFGLDTITFFKKMRHLFQASLDRLTNGPFIDMLRFGNRDFVHA